jgi:SAM-dependent methyltransferase
MHPKELKHAFESGQNVTEILKQRTTAGQNTQTNIEIAYDLQAGTYSRAMESDSMFAHKQAYGLAIANEILALTDPSSILETGIGEGTTMSFVLEGIGNPRMEAYGFDLSWSRIAWCKNWMRDHWSGDSHLSIASLTNLPYADSCFDVVYSSHTIEPNGGNERTILQELFRISSRFLVLVEPSYELAAAEAQQRMDRLGYCRGLVETATQLGLRVLKHDLLGCSVNPLNPSAVTVIEKNPAAPAQTPRLVCPNHGDALIDFGDSLFSPGSLHAYPKVLGIPCLRPEDAIFASAFREFLGPQVKDPERYVS